MTASLADVANDPVAFAQALMRRPSVTPDDGGIMDMLQSLLEAHGFACHRLPFGEGDARTENLYARWGTSAPNLCFAGHVDVVPVGDAAAWKTDPFGAEIRDGILYGRGACDMKAAVATFIVAALNVIKNTSKTPENDLKNTGSISLLLTSDEEGPGTYGTQKVIEWLQQKGEIIDSCIVGEPTNPAQLGEMIKIGRRGSLTGHLKVQGKQGHAAYPALADNPIPRLVKLLDALAETPLDFGTDHFQPSNLEIVNIEVGNTASNIIPAAASAVFNVRFNTQFTGESLGAKIREELDYTGLSYDLELTESSTPFFNEPGKLATTLQTIVAEVTGKTPQFTTDGGTSDARFIHKICPVVEFGLDNATAHHIDEHVRVQDIKDLCIIYQQLIDQSLHTTTD